MFRTAMLALLLVAVISPTLPARTEEPGAKPAPPDANELRRQANDLWHTKKDYNGALAAFNQAVDAAPNDADIRLQRAYFFEYVSGIVTKDEVEKFKDLSRQDYQKIATDAPDSMRAGVARDGLTRLSGKTLLTPAAVKCPSEAVDAYGRAESLLSADKFAESISQYEKATEACPSAADFWLGFADAYYGLKQYAKAKELFRRALEADPWSRMGHRFLADAEGHLNNGDAAVHEAALAVVSDPVYEAAWSSLRNYANVTGREWKRVYGVKTDVTATDSTKGTGKDITINVPMTEPQDATTPGHKHRKPKAGTKSKESNPDDLGWMSYGLFKAGAMSGSVTEQDASGKPVEKKIDPSTLTALDIERIGVRGALDVAGEVAASTSDTPGPFWAMMMRADKAGFLDEAIFLHMLDEPLAKEYPAFREKNATKLVEYLETMIVPKS